MLQEITAGCITVKKKNKIDIDIDIYKKIRYTGIYNFGTDFLTNFKANFGTMLMTFFGVIFNENYVPVKV